VDGLVADHPLVTDLDPDRVEEHQRVNRVERSLLPGGDFIEHCVRHRADQVGRHVDAVQIMQMPGDLAGAHAPRVHRDAWLWDDPPDHPSPALSSKPGKRR
jgi:hypothetical protein